MSAINCFWMNPTGKIRRSLLVIALGTVCKKRSPAVCRHQVYAGEHTAIVDKEGYPEWVDIPDPEMTSDLWPRRCEFCDEPFGSDAMFSSIQELIYVAADGQRYTLRDAPDGAMWDEPGRASQRAEPSEDGKCICVKTPGGVWCIDGPAWENGQAKPGRGWTRTGTPPKITAHPSIHILTSGFDGAPPKTVYHGWLKDGVLIDA